MASSSSSSSSAPTRKGRDYAAKAESALREGRLDEAKMWHKNASNAFKEARDALLEGDASTRMALTLLVDYHREREKNPGDPKQVYLKAHHPAVKSLQAEPATSPKTLSGSHSLGSITEAWNAVQEFGEGIQSAATPPPLPESSAAVRPTRDMSMSTLEWKKGTQSVMAESFLMVGGDTLPSALGPERSISGASNSGFTRSISGRENSLEKLQAANKSLTNEVEKLAKENSQLRSMLLRERDEAKAQRDKFWKMFVLVKAALEEAKIPLTTNPSHSPSAPTSYESELKALTRLLHAETEARKKAESELEALRRRYS